MAACCLSPVLPAQTPSPVAPPQALIGVRVLGEEGARTILVRDGRIERLVAVETPVPVGYERVEAEGLVAAPAFLDAYTHAGCETVEPTVDQDRPLDVGAGVRTDMRAANRKGIQPTFRAAEVWALEGKDLEKWHAAGFGALLSAPHGELLAGRSVLVAARDAARRDVVLRDDVFQHAAFRASGGGYPSTLMGYHAQLRQFLMDAAHQRELEARWEAGRSGPRPPHDELLEAAWSLLDGKTLLVCEAETARDVHRWLGLADEFGLRIAIAGGRDAWKAAATLKERGIPVVLTLDWGDEVDDPRPKGDEAKEGEEGESHEADDADVEPDDATGADEDATEGDDEDPDDEGDEADDVEEAEEPPPIDWSYTEPLAVRLDKRLRWEERRDAALRFAEAGVPILFGTGSGKPGDLLDHVRTLVEGGLSRELALGALTTRGAEWTGAGRALAGITPGAAATLCLWTADPLDEDAQVRFALVDGHRHEYEVKEKGSEDPPAKGVDLTGTWNLTMDAETGVSPTLVLTMDEDGEVTGTISMKDPVDDSDVSAPVEGRVSGKQVELEAELAVAGTSVKLSLSGKWKDGAFSGTSTIRFGGQSQEAKFEAVPAGDDGGVQ